MIRALHGMEVAPPPHPGQAPTIPAACNALEMWDVVNSIEIDKTTLNNGVITFILKKMISV